MDSLRYSVIVPMMRFDANEPVLQSLRETRPKCGALEIIVAIGHEPARQRNAALAHAQGELLLFLDNDCVLGPCYWTEMEKAFARPEVEILGGPAMLRSRATFWEEIFHALLTHTLIVGTVSSRYVPRGVFRPATQTDLILCNLAVRRSIFNKIGRLSTDLYPNEENEWLDRAHAAGIGAYYDPALHVFRPQRKSPGQMAATLLRYGMGRTRQFRVSGWRPTFHQLLPLMVVGTFFILFDRSLELEFAFLWLLASVVVATSCNSSLSIGQRIVAGLIAPLIPLTYAVGQLLGWLTIFSSARASETGVDLLNEHGERIAASLH